MEFEKRLERALERGHAARASAGRASAAEQLSADEGKALFSKARLDVVERIELCLHQLADRIPGFQFSSLMGERGWGAMITRDDLDLRRSDRPNTHYSRLEVLVSPPGSAQILELVAKGTVRNREVFHRRTYQRLSELDLDTFRQMVDLWVLEYAELYASS